MVLSVLLSVIIAATSVSIIDPVDGETYEGDWLSFRVIVENDNEVPDSVHYSLNGSDPTQIPKLNTDWPTYMQNYQNTGFSESSAPTNETVLWSAPVTGILHEFPTPVVADGIVYYPSNYGTDSLYALNAATGEILWKYHTGYTDDAVTVSNGMVYTPSDSLCCINAYSGEKVWSTALAGPDGGTPIVSDGNVYAALWVPFTRLTSLTCFDALTGTVVWNDTIPGRPACCMALHENRLYLATFSPVSANGLYAIDASNGDVIWCNTDSEDGYWDSSPVILDSVLYIGGCDGIIRAVGIYSGETIWEENLSDEYVTATPAISEAFLLVGSQTSPYYCLDIFFGSSIWTAPFYQHGSTAVADGIAFFGECFYYEPEPVDSSSIVALDTNTGDTVWSITLQSSDVGFQGSPAVTDGVMYFPATDGNLYAFGTGLKYTYRKDNFYADIGSNELIVTSWDDGVAVTADTISFIVTQTGISLEPSRNLNLYASPNPIDTSTSICFELGESGYASVKIFDLSGREVSTLVDQELVTGVYSVQWNGSGDDGFPLSSGLYLCRIEHRGVVETTGLCLLR